MKTTFKLSNINEKLSLICTDENIKFSPIFVDFNSNKLNYRLKHGGGKKQAIVRAVGLKPNKPLNVIDATAGLGKDAFILASCGAKVFLIERNETIYELLKDGFNRAQNIPNLSPIISKMKLYKGNAIELIPKLYKQISPDVIYLDPMFPKASNTALPKKELIALRNIVHDDLDENTLFDVAMAHAKLRVVVKRAKLSPFIQDTKPDHCLIGRANRFDIYIKKISKS